MSYKAPKQKRVIFRDSKGKFVKESQRYDKDRVDSVWRFVRGRYVAVIEPYRTRKYKVKVNPELLSNLLNRYEFEKLKEATRRVRDYKSPRKYKLLDIAKQIDKTKGIRGSRIKVTIRLKEGRKTRVISFRHHLFARKSQALAIYKHMSEQLDMLGHWVGSPKFGYKPVTDQAEAKLKLVSVSIDKVL